MRGMGIRGLLTKIVAGLALSVATLAVAEEKQPEWKFTVEESALADFEAVQFHPKDDGWLMTCRMRVKSLKLVAPISELEFIGVDAADEEVWDESHTIRRKDFEAAYGGGRSQFVRVLLREVPADVVELRLQYGPVDDSEGTE